MVRGDAETVLLNCRQFSEDIVMPAALQRAA